VVFNDEVDAVVLGSAVAQDFQKTFEADMAKARAIDRAAWRRRPITQRLLELFEVTSFLWQNWL
jgi:phosphatidylserine/phosphatidylglycerophosphate/cardiolipin synthase-like enzyme